MLKNIPPVGLDMLLSILNKIWSSGIIPDSWKEFRVIPIPKSGASSGSYRPIAISSIFCKVVEHILKKSS
jgi:hypothetical protein